MLSSKMSRVGELAGVENLLFFGPFAPLNTILGVSFTSSSDEHIDCPAHITEERYELLEGYKLGVQPFWYPKLATCTTYQCDFENMLDRKTFGLYVPVFGSLTYLLEKYKEVFVVGNFPVLASFYGFKYRTKQEVSFMGRVYYEGKRIIADPEHEILGRKVLSPDMDTFLVAYAPAQEVFPEAMEYWFNWHKGQKEYIPPVELDTDDMPDDIPDECIHEYYYD